MAITDRIPSYLIEPLGVLRRIHGKLVRALRELALSLSETAVPCRFLAAESRQWVSVRSGKIHSPEASPLSVVLKASDGSQVSVTAYFPDDDNRN
jgi:hypothetical protein